MAILKVNILTKNRNIVYTLTFRYHLKVNQSQMPPSISILKTKFFIPQPTSDFVERKSLGSSFNKLEKRPIMLVSASTGFGKSTVVADFLSKLNDDYTWLSLSEKENEFKQFITYFIKAIQIKSPNFGTTALALKDAPQ